MVQPKIQDPLLAEGEKEKKTITVTDKNGKQVSVGNVIRVAQELKAHQVPPAGRGGYNQDRQFVPDSASKHLLVPVGLRGVVTKVYSDGDLSANFKIQVKFTPGMENNDEGYEPPVAFQMHFGSDEVECIL
jgi:hypothetical protein